LKSCRYGRSFTGEAQDGVLQGQPIVLPRSLVANGFRGLRSSTTARGYHCFVQTNGSSCRGDIIFQDRHGFKLNYLRSIARMPTLRPEVEGVSSADRVLGLSTTLLDETPFPDSL
jgi:hypothetical protein